MTIAEYKEKLKELHEAIKNNPFRRGYAENAKYGKGYYDTVYKFAETFYHLTKDIQRNRIEVTKSEDKKLAKVADACDFVHDFYGAVNRNLNTIDGYNHGYKDNLDTIHEEEEFIELCISCIHCYLDTGMFSRYPFKSRDKIVWAEWHDDKGDYMIDFSK